MYRLQFEEVRFGSATNMDFPDDGPFKAFIGNLPFDGVQGDIEAILKYVGFTDDQIHSFQVRMVRDRETDKFKGFAYVEFNTADELRKVLDINGVDYGGRPLKIDIASQRANDRGGRGGRGGRSGGWTAVDHRVGHGQSSGFRGGHTGRQRRRPSDRHLEEDEFVEHPDPRSRGRSGSPCQIIHGLDRLSKRLLVPVNLFGREFSQVYLPTSLFVVRLLLVTFCC
ncbi:hypothetical protein RB195_008235 [Necator americanus]|uniref:RRM domain-containing protein n=1 Tax=Necator americanus TaxID=51031 RepID=A0ABR1CML7_NECAM